MYAMCDGDVELNSIEYFRGYGCWQRCCHGNVRRGSL